MSEPIVEEAVVVEEEAQPVPPPPPVVENETKVAAPTVPPEPPTPEKEKEVIPPKVAHVRLGPTGRHINDLLPRKKEEPPARKVDSKSPRLLKKSQMLQNRLQLLSQLRAEDDKNLKKGKKVREFKDLKPLRKGRERSFDGRDRQGLAEEDERWRKKRPLKGMASREEQVMRPNKLKIRLPITLKDLAVEMKLKSSEIIQKLFLHGMTYTLNDLLDDETTVQYIGNEFGCEIKIDTAEQERIQITSQTIRARNCELPPRKS